MEQHQIQRKEDVIQQKITELADQLMEEEYYIKNGRPTRFNTKLAHYLLRCIIDGNSLNKAINLYNEKCEEAGTPPLHRVTVYGWMNTYKKFGDAVQRARSISSAAVYDDVVALEEDILQGNTGFKEGRVVLESKRWRAEKLDPDTFGRQVNVHGKHEVDVRITSAIPEPKALDAEDIVDAEEIKG